MVIQELPISICGDQHADYRTLALLFTAVHCLPISEWGWSVGLLSI